MDLLLPLDSSWNISSSSVFRLLTLRLELTPSALLGLQLVNCTSWDFPPSTTVWTNSLWYISFYVYIYILLVLLLWRHWLKQVSLRTGERVLWADAVIVKLKACEWNTWVHLPPGWGLSKTCTATHSHLDTVDWNRGQRGQRMWWFLNVLLLKCLKVNWDWESFLFLFFLIGVKKTTHIS